MIYNNQRNSKGGSRMLRDANSGYKEIVPRRGDFLHYNRRLSQLEYHRPGRAAIVWDNQDDKINIPRLADPNAFVAIGETIAAIFGLVAKMDNSHIEQNPNMRDEYWAIYFF